MLFLNIIYVLMAIAMIALILMQRGAGAQAGSGFGGGASGTVFGARGSSNFLSKTTKWLAVAFFALSLVISWNAGRNAGKAGPADTGSLMSQVPVAPAGDTSVPAAPAANDGTVPAAPAAIAPAVPAPSTPTAAPVAAPATAPVQTAPAPAATTPQSPLTGG